MDIYLPKNNIKDFMVSDQDFMFYGRKKSISGMNILALGMFFRSLGLFLKKWKKHKGH